MSDASFFLNEKKCDALLAIAFNGLGSDHTHASEVRKRIDTPYAYTVKIVDRLEEEGYVEKKPKKGRKIPLKATEKGTRTAEKLKEFKKVIRDE